MSDTFDVLDPATEETIATLHDSTVDEAFDALSRAVEVQKVWAAVPPQRRADLLTRVFDLVNERAEEFATTMTREMGKPLAEARGEVTYGNSYFRWFAGEAVRIPGRFSTAPAGNGHILVSRAPVGPVLAITPWNFPLAMATRKIAPALAAGCPIIVKPAKETPLTMLLLGEVFDQVFSEFAEEFGDLTGLVSIVASTSSSKISEALMADDRLRKVTFTGSSPVGRTLVRQSADRLLRTSMELGGNAPFVVAADADLDLVLSAAMSAKMRNGGEACIAANRFLVDEAIAEEFISRLTETMSEVVMGNGQDDGVTLGPMITGEQRDRIAELVDDAVAAGAVATTGGSVPDQPGYFYPATVLTDIPQDATILNEEIFGPVATVSTFSGVEQGTAMANDTEFGLAAYGFSTSVETAQYLAENLDAGMVGINRGAISDAAAPFGGVKQSGFGREGGVEGIEEYLEPKYIALN
jgi:succinate-semialdehyde dehydrogenase/glutarate-semialdehyde dehydrogenase